jgi:tetratricopeptide (TPR) repeat protein
MLIKAKTSIYSLSRSLVSGAIAFCFLAASPGIVSSLPGFDSYGAVQAAEKKPKDTRETRRTPALRNAVYEKLSAAQIAAEEKDYREALSILDSLKNTTGKKELNGYEKANMYNFYAFVYYAQENYPKVIQAYRNVIAQPDIPLAMELNTKYQLAQLYFVVEDYKGAIKELNDWLNLTDDAQTSAHVI